MNIDAPPRNKARCVVDEKKYEVWMNVQAVAQEREASECYQHPCKGCNVCG